MSKFIDSDFASAARLTRRGMFQSVSGGLCGAALSYLVGDTLTGSAQLLASEKPGDLKPRPPHFAPKAKSVIHLFMNGGPSQMDLFDPKPELDKHHGQAYADRIAGEIEFLKDAGSLMRSPFKFAKHGQCGAWVSEAMPHLAGVVDEVAFIRSMFTTNLTHEPAVYLIQTGKMGPGRPTLGSWVVYGLGSENQNMPAYIVLDDPRGLPVNGVENWQAGFLPPMFQGTRFRSTGSPVLNLNPEKERPKTVANAERDLLAKLDQLHKTERPGQPVLDARIASYELAARMQLEATDALDISKEPQSIRDMYGIGREPTDSYGRRCLIARRLVERGVRFVQLYINQQIWDNHTSLASELKSACNRTDQPTAALLRDLKQRGLFDSTLVVWGGEFGRLPIAQLPPDKNERQAGRDHNKNAFCTWMAGAGIKGGTSYGKTDELGMAAVENRVSVGDWHATILHLLGMHYDQLFYEQNGLKEKLTGVEEAHVVKGILS
ncbi:DUF1501 domain-containing protein [Telmatocola sphagniphila]|uniref:DUF1501 domain-containing protein n=1 Tax=Telmatocola sphagniphila TaxID=1123043 RepID=A0A8E6EWL5_9BACT|nr:DUF1501 domain-containing protein [Telmatocola sphagniphila]QVL34105.1 DUF1501 domain-containing protein [Telmatocola sphagniphila]